MSFMEAIASGFKRYVDFSGRSVRSEYWYWALFCFIAQICLSVVYGPLGLAFALATFLPSLAVTVRRLHDIDKSGWWVLISLVPIIGWVVLLVQVCTKGTDGPNRFGSSHISLAPAAAPG